MSIASRLNQAWLNRGLIAYLLWPLSVLMRLLVALRRLAYHRGWVRSEHLPMPVLVVGNRVVGGAGKTPTTIALLLHLKANGWRPGVLSRGYKARGGADEQDDGHVLIDTRTAAGLSATHTGDEPLLIWRRTGVPVMVGRDRVAGGHALLKAHPEVNILVCDDGLQHLKLQRDIEIVVFDERGVGNGWLLPAGPLREPINVSPPPHLRARPIVLYNASAPSTRLAGHLARRGLAAPTPLADWWQGRDSGDTFHASTLTADAPPAWAIAGIAQPQRFFDALTAQGLRIHGLGLDDHADFGTLPWPMGVEHVIVTEKDAVKLAPETVADQRPGCRVWVAVLDFRPEDSFWTALDAALASLAAPPHTGLPDGHTTH